MIPPFEIEQYPINNNSSSHKNKRNNLLNVYPLSPRLLSPTLLSPTLLSPSLLSPKNHKHLPVSIRDKPKIDLIRKVREYWNLNIENDINQGDDRLYENFGIVWNQRFKRLDLRHPVGSGSFSIVMQVNDSQQENKIELERNRIIERNKELNKVKRMKKTIDSIDAFNPFNSIPDIFINISESQLGLSYSESEQYILSTSFIVGDGSCALLSSDDLTALIPLRKVKRNRNDLDLDERKEFDIQDDIYMDEIMQNETEDQSYN
ncbi:MAG: hypothetical protein EZS28_026138 [Streblomastix strix]|uniref:Uncharacterized protein n=1 Tax=Streblomastix strix TaxID=222440 RepID=A0A5J4V5Z5_9EUKA|nr:MAG: hypothetical protein EZS28_026138 [Streblomastix strix]